MRILVAALLTVQLAGCSKHKDAPAASSGSAAKVAAPTAPATAAASAPDVACKLITADDAAKLLGHPVTPGEAKMAGPVPSCHFKPTDGSSASMSVQYYERGEANLDAIGNMMIKEPVAISGAGTKAIRNKDGSLLLVLANGHLGVVMAIAMGKNAGPTAAAADAFAPVLASRL